MSSSANQSTPNPARLFALLLAYAAIIAAGTGVAGAFDVTSSSSRYFSSPGTFATYAAAEDYCQSQNAYLLSIGSASEQTAVSGMLDTSSTYILGAQYKSYRGNYTWESGMVWDTYENWNGAGYSADTASNPYVLMHGSDGTWYNVDGSGLSSAGAYAVCKYSTCAGVNATDTANICGGKPGFAACIAYDQCQCATGVMTDAVGTGCTCPQFDTCGVCMGDNSTCADAASGSTSTSPDILNTERTSLVLYAIPYDEMTSSQKLAGVPFLRFNASATYVPGEQYTSIVFNCSNADVYSLLNNDWSVSEVNITIDGQLVTQATYTQDVSTIMLYQCFGDTYSSLFSQLSADQYKPGTMNYIGGLVDIQVLRSSSSLNEALDGYRNATSGVEDPLTSNSLLYRAPAYFVVQTSATGVSTTTTSTATFSVDIQVVNRVWTPDSELVLVMRTCTDQYTKSDGSSSEIILVDEIDMGSLVGGTSPDFALYTNSTACDFDMVPGKCCQVFAYKSVNGASQNCFNTQRQFVWETYNPDNIPSLSGQLAKINVALDVCKPPELQFNTTVTSDTATLKTFTDATLQTEGSTFVQGQTVNAALAIDGLTASQLESLLLSAQFAQMCYAGSDWTDADGSYASCSSSKSKKFTLYDAGSSYSGGSRWNFQHSHTAFAGVVNTLYTTSHSSVEFYRFISNVMTAPSKYPSQLQVTWKATLNQQAPSGGSLYLNSKRSRLYGPSSATSRLVDTSMTTLFSNSGESGFIRYLSSPDSRKKLLTGTESVLQYVDADLTAPDGTVSVLQGDAVTLSTDFYPSSGIVISSVCSTGTSWDSVTSMCQTVVVGPIPYENNPPVVVDDGGSGSNDSGSSTPVVVVPPAPAPAAVGEGLSATAKHVIIAASVVGGVVAIVILIVVEQMFVAAAGTAASGAAAAAASGAAAIAGNVSGSRKSHAGSSGKHHKSKRARM
jgi:hypothetical protein